MRQEHRKWLVLRVYKIISTGEHIIVNENYDWITHDVETT